MELFSMAVICEGRRNRSQELPKLPHIQASPCFDNKDIQRVLEKISCFHFFLLMAKLYAYVCIYAKRHETQQREEKKQQHFNEWNKN
ncbi:CLUMA_CG001449, isoform A [Clunio marinus]|uniref:CLUMA_CG001449, isoform A n=1 Tax=Clunio marinus TaxID=568069 RepID=A0A1J1HHY8_9DIPT|nr:CLUMA_CG001449, isoform A [Clunio marinus]